MCQLEVCTVQEVCSLMNKPDEMTHNGLIISLLLWPTQLLQDSTVQLTMGRCHQDLSLTIVTIHGEGVVRSPMASHGQNHPGVKYVGDKVHKQAYPREPESTLLLSCGTPTSVQSQHSASPVPRLLRGHLVINRNSYFEEGKPAGPSRPNTANWDPHGQTKPGSFVFHKCAPNRHGVFGSGFSLPQSWSHDLYQRGFPGYGPGREAAVPRSGVLVMSHSSVGRMKTIWVPTMNVEQFGQGNTVTKHLPTKIKFI